MFDLNEPKDLYRIIHNVYGEYVKHPTEQNFLFLVLSLTHLREWIAESKYNIIEKKQKECTRLTDGEKFFIEIHSLSSFGIIQDLCNRAKHFISRGEEVQTTKTEGLRSGIGKAGDKANQVYFLIDGRDSREHFVELIHKYNGWFSKHG